MKRANPRWRDAVARLRVGISGWRMPVGDAPCSLSAEDLERLDRVLDAILTAKSAEATGAGMLAAVGIPRARRPRRSLAKTASDLRGLRDRLYADFTFSDSYTVPLVEVLDAIAAGGTARAIGERVLALFGAPGGRGRRPSRAIAQQDALAAAQGQYEYWLHVVDDDERAYMEVKRLYRAGRTVAEIAFAVRWPVDRVVAALEPIFGKVSNAPT